MWYALGVTSFCLMVAVSCAGWPSFITINHYHNDDKEK
jgi:hypothetical protein